MSRSFSSRMTAIFLTMALTLTAAGCKNTDLPDTYDPTMSETEETRTEIESLESSGTETSTDIMTTEFVPIAQTESVEITEETTWEIPETTETVSQTTEDVTEEETETSAPETTTEAPVPQSISVKVNGTHYIGDSLSAADFTITVNMSDGSTKKNPAGWSADPLHLAAHETVIAITYGLLTDTITVFAEERPAETQQAEDSTSAEPVQKETYPPAAPQMALDRGRAEEAWAIQKGIIEAEAFSLETGDHTGYPIKWSEWLYEEACRRAMEIAVTFGHYNVPEHCAENIGRGYQTPESIIDAWYNSEGHKRNMLGGWDYGAIACYGGYWVALFKQQVPY